MQSSKGRILFVEDHEDTTELITLLLQMWGYEVSHTYTISAALKLAQQDQFNLYLFDHKLPDGTGVELCTLIRKSDPKTPVLFCSASAHPSEIDKAMSAGAQAYITKPADPVVLEEAISRLLKAACKTIDSRIGQ